jgi:uncharacterized protein with HEPN domain
MKRDEGVFLEDIYESVEKIMLYTKELDEQDFYESTEKQDAVIRRLEIIGEAAKKISQQTRDAYPNIPWKEMSGMRDVLIHEYFGVSPSIVWNVIRNELNHLLPTLKEILEKE